MRTLLAYLVAPAISALVIAVLFYAYGIEGMLAMLFAVSLFTFPVSLGVAIVDYLVLRKLKKVNIIHYLLAGAVGASPFTALWSIGENVDLTSLLLPTFTGALVGALVMILQRPKDPSRRSDQLRYGSASTT